MNIVFSEKSWKDYLYWQKNDKRNLKKVNFLIKDVSRIPFEGLGKPEPLKYELAGFWSRRIDGEHRLIYEIKGKEIRIASCRYHY